MIGSSRKLIFLTVCTVAALGATIVFAVFAYAEAGAKWQVNGAVLTNPLLPLVVGEIEKLKSGEEHLVLKTAVGMTEVKVLCEVLAIEDGLIHEGGKSSAELKFSSCKTFLAGTESVVCKPAEPIIAKVKGLIVLHEFTAGVKTPLNKFEPATGANLAVIKFVEACVIETNWPNGMAVTGSAYVKDSNGKFTTEEFTHLVEEEGTSLGGLKFGPGNRTAKVEGSLVLKLSGTHNNLKWSGKPA